jgi:hypothetical protein
MREIQRFLGINKTQNNRGIPRVAKNRTIVELKVQK